MQLRSLVELQKFGKLSPPHSCVIKRGPGVLPRVARYGNMPRIGQIYWPVLPIRIYVDTLPKFVTLNCWARVTADAWFLLVHSLYPNQCSVYYSQACSRVRFTLLFKGLNFKLLVRLQSPVVHFEQRTFITARKQSNLSYLYRLHLSERPA